jgi:hypothetical protein
VVYSGALLVELQSERLADMSTISMRKTKRKIRQSQPIQNRFGGWESLKKPLSRLFYQSMLPYFETDS